jgi:hypothetical protein
MVTAVPLVTDVGLVLESAELPSLFAIADVPVVESLENVNERSNEGLMRRVLHGSSRLSGLAAGTVSVVNKRQLSQV